MIEPTSLAGSAEPGRQAQAEFPFLKGPTTVGVRDRDGWMDVAFFAPEVRAKLPADGLLDGQPVRVIAISTRVLDPTIRTRGAMCAITATVVANPEA
jgi:hypothetical protein